MKTKDRLFTVSASFAYVVEADSLKDAHNAAYRYMRDAFGDLSTCDIDCIVDHGINAEWWDNDSIPYGGDGMTRTGEYK